MKRLHIAPYILYNDHSPLNLRRHTWHPHSAVEASADGVACWVASSSPTPPPSNKFIVYARMSDFLTVFEG